MAEDCRRCQQRCPYDTGCSGTKVTKSTGVQAGTCFFKNIYIVALVNSNYYNNSHPFFLGVDNMSGSGSERWLWSVFDRSVDDTLLNMPLSLSASYMESGGLGDRDLVVPLLLRCSFSSRSNNFSAFFFVALLRICRSEYAICREIHQM